MTSQTLNYLKSSCYLKIATAMTELQDVSLMVLPQTTGRTELIKSLKSV